MRPVAKGAPPRDGSGFEIAYSGVDGHQSAKHELHLRLGRYCSYCERKTDLHVEHVIPKKKHDDLKHLWVNYLLACHNCNATKLEKDPLTTEWDCLFPDEVNTEWAFIYGPGAKVHVNPLLTAADRDRANATLRMVGLDRIPPPDPRDKDLRWLDRDSAWQQAEDAREDMARSDTPQARKRILVEATATGFFSIWWTIFANDQDILRRNEMRTGLIASFKARAACFHDDGSVRQSL